MSETVMKVLRCDKYPELIGQEYTVEITNASMDNLRNIFGDIKTPILIARVYYPSRLRSGSVLIGNMEYTITNSVHMKDATTWYLAEYREHG